MTTEFAMRRFQIDGSIRFSYTSFVGFAMKILHTLLRGYVHTYTRARARACVCVCVCVCVSTASNPRAIQWPLVIKLFRLLGLGR